METPPPTDSFNDFGYRKSKKRRPENSGQTPAEPYRSNGPRKPYGARDGEERREGGGGEGFRKPHGPRKPYGPPRGEGTGGGFRKPYGPRKPFHKDGSGKKKPYGEGPRPSWRKKETD